MATITLTVDDDHLTSIDEVADALRERGMQVDQVLGDIGVITGSVPEESAADLESVQGVESVSREVRVQLPPPDSELQ